MKHYNTNNVRSFAGISPIIGENVLIDASAVVIGDVVLGDDVSVWPQVAIRGDMHRIRIGARTSVQDGCVLHITHAGPYNDGGWLCYYQLTFRGRNIKFTVRWWWHFRTLAR